MKQLKRGDIDSEMGVWQPVQRQDGTRSAILSCPDCGAVFTLSNHKIDPDGAVHPSVVLDAHTKDEYGAQLICPGCHMYHDNVQLEGWEVRTP
jgi:hypothetical protein